MKQAASAPPPGVQMVPIVPGGTDLAVARVKAAIERGDINAETLAAEVANADRYQVIPRTRETRSGRCARCGCMQTLYVGRNLCVDNEACWERVEKRE